MRILVILISVLFSFSSQARIIDVYPSSQEKVKKKSADVYLYSTSERIRVGVLVDIDTYVEKFIKKQHSDAIELARKNLQQQNDKMLKMDFSTKIRKSTVTDIFLGFFESTAIVNIEIEVHVNVSQKTTCTAALDTRN